MLFVCCSNSLYTQICNLFSGRPMYRVSTSLFMAHMFSARERCHNRESVDYIADTTHLISFVRYFKVPLQIRVVVITAKSTCVM